MQTSRKSFKAFSVAQPLKKEIDQTLIKVELEKRKYLTLEREQTYLKQTLDKKRKDLNELKAKQPQTKTFTTRAWQTNNVINNVDKNYLFTYDSIQQLKNAINVHRKQNTKYKEMNLKLDTDINNLTKKNDSVNNQNVDLQNKNEELKIEIMQYREKNLRNTAEFTKSHTNINRSNANEENQRKKFSMNQKSFLGEEFKNSKIIPFGNLSDQLRTSGIKFSEHSNEIMTASVPLAKERIKIEIRKNKQKLRISDNYKRFGQNLENMFQIMKEYKGRDDLDFIAQEFVTKEKQLQKIEEYIGQLQSRIEHSQTILRARKNEDEVLKQEINKRVEKDDQKYIILQQKTTQDIKQLKQQEAAFFEWFNTIGSILMPLIEEPLTRNNAANQIGEIESSLNLQREEVDKRPAGKIQGLPAIDLQQRQIYSEMMNYDKLRDFAYEYVKTKKAN